MFADATRSDRNKSVRGNVGVMDIAGEDEENRSRWFVDVLRKVDDDDVVKKTGEISVVGKQCEKDRPSKKKCIR